MKGGADWNKFDTKIQALVEQGDKMTDALQKRLEPLPNRVAEIKGKIEKLLDDAKGRNDKEMQKEIEEKTAKLDEILKKVTAGQKIRSEALDKLEKQLDELQKFADPNYSGSDATGDLGNFFNQSASSTTPPVTNVEKKASEVALDAAQAPEVKKATEAGVSVKSAAISPTSVTSGPTTPPTSTYADMTKKRSGVNEQGTAALKSALSMRGGYYSSKKYSKKRKGNRKKTHKGRKSKGRKSKAHKSKKHPKRKTHRKRR
jgi:hypothetical protein